MSTTSGTGAAGSGILDGKVPVFVFPVQLDFYYEDQTTHKRVVTIYNPYEFDVTFKVLCNNPKKYAVVEPEGKIFGQKCVDIVIRHVAVSPQTCETTDKFRIHMFEEGNSEVRLYLVYASLTHLFLVAGQEGHPGDATPGAAPCRVLVPGHAAEEDPGGAQQPRRGQAGGAGRGRDTRTRWCEAAS